MPPAIIPGIIMAAVSVAQVGMQLAGVGQPARPPDPTKQPLTPAQNKAQQSAVSQALPDLQNLTGGSLSPEYAAQFGATQAGLGNDPKAAGNIQAAINQFFGLAAPGQTGLTGGSSSSGTGGSAGLPGILEFIKNPALASRGIEGGMVDQTLQGSDFKGLAG